MAAIIIATLLANGGQPATVTPDYSTTADLAPSTLNPTSEPDMIVVSDGSHDALLLEWAGGPENATSWQYRTRTWADYRPQAWGSWANVPNSGASTRRYRLMDLMAEMVYDAQIRAVVGTTAGAASNVGQSHTYRAGSIPYIEGGHIVEGDGATEWRVHGCGCLVTIPDGMRLRGPRDISELPRYTVQDVATGSFLTLTTGGGEVERKITTQAQGDEAQDADVRRVNALFDQIVASARATPPPSGALTLIVISDGTADALRLEWTGGSSDADGWQFRTRLWVSRAPQSWGSWTNVPNSGATTRSLRLTGLSADGAYDVQVRPVVGTKAGSPSNVGQGHTYPTDRIPHINRGQIVEGDGKTEWGISGCNCVVTVPKGMRLQGGQGRYTRTGEGWTPVIDLISGSTLTFGDFGIVVGRSIITPAQNAKLDPNRDVGAFFDQIVASVRATTTATPSPSGPLTLIVISKGEADALTLEWTGGPSNATSWQYRKTHWNQQAYRREGWGRWTNMPAHVSSSYRVTGLRAYTGYFFEVRPVVGGRAGTASDTATGVTHHAGAPTVPSGQIAEGDGKTEWRIRGCACVVTIPDKMLLRGTVGNPESFRYTVQDVHTGSYLVFRVGGWEDWREINTRARGDETQTADVQRVHALFDQILASVRVSVPATPPPSEPR